MTIFSEAIEEKIRHVQDARYWGRPVGTPITPGMKPKAPRNIAKMPVMKRSGMQHGVPKPEVGLLFSHRQHLDMMRIPESGEKQPHRVYRVSRVTNESVYYTDVSGYGHFATSKENWPKVYGGEAPENIEPIVLKVPMPLTPVSEDMPKREYSDSAWEEVDINDFHDEIVKNHVKQLIREGVIRPEDGNTFMDHYSRQFKVPHRVVQNGPVTIVAYKDASDKAIRNTSLAIDEMMRVDPLTQMTVALDSDEFDKPGNETYAGFSALGDSHIQLRSESMEQFEPAPEDDDRHMHSARSVAFFYYLLTHEWGHARERGEMLDDQTMLGAMEPGTTLWSEFSKTGEMNAYAIQNLREIYADAYAEWILTRGKPKTMDGKPNAFVTKLAKRFRWPS